MSEKRLKEGLLDEKLKITLGNVEYVPQRYGLIFDELYGTILTPIYKINGEEVRIKEMSEDELHIIRISKK